MNRSRLLPLLLAALVAGCASTGPVAIGNGQYMLAKQGTGFGAVSEIKAELIKEATAHCASQGRGFLLVNSSGRDMTALSYPSAEISYTCPAKG
jgi:hypothetical protein